MLPLSLLLPYFPCSPNNNKPSSTPFPPPHHDDPNSFIHSSYLSKSCFDTLLLHLDTAS